MVIRIPIEVQTSESTEIRELLDRIDRAEDTLSKIRTAPPTPDTAGGRAEAAALLQGERGATGITAAPRRDVRGPIGAAEEARTTPIGTSLEVSPEVALPRGKGGELQPSQGGPQDLVRQNQFKQLVEKQKGLEDQFNQALGLGGQAIGTGIAISGGRGIQGLLQKIAPIAGPVAAAFFVKALTDAIIAELIKPGGIMDRRFKRDFEREFNIFRTREDKGRIRAGLSEVRVSFGDIGKRAAAHSISTTLQAAKTGFFADEELELSFVARNVP